MSLQTFITGITKVVSGLENTLPLLQSIPGFPIADTVLKAASAIAETITNVTARAGEANIVINSSDQDLIKHITERLAALNDDLMKYVDES